MLSDNLLPTLLLLTPNALARDLPTGPTTHTVLDALLFETRACLPGTDFALVQDRKSVV